MARQPLVGAPYDRAQDYAQNTIVEKGDGVLYRVRHCKWHKYQLTRLCEMCARVGRARGAERGETRCTRCNGTFREPEQRRGDQIKGYHAARGGFEVQVRVCGVPRRKWVQTETLARLLAERWLAEKAEACKAKT